MNSPLALRRRGELAAVRDRAMRPRRLRSAKTYERPTRIGLWLPVTPFFWLLAPFAILLAPLLLLAPPLQGMNPYAAVIAIGRVLTSLGGTEVDVDIHDTRIRIRIL